MPRTIIEIPAEKLREVDRICRALAISRAEAVRRGLTEFIRQNEAVQEEGLAYGAAAMLHPTTSLTRFGGSGDGAFRHNSAARLPTRR